MNENNTLQGRLKQWADKSLPVGVNHLEKLKEEVEELIDNPEDGMEMADILLSLMLYSSSFDINLLEIAEQKFKIVQSGKYGAIDTNGISRHIK